MRGRLHSRTRVVKHIVDLGLLLINFKEALELRLVKLINRKIIE